MQNVTLYIHFNTTILDVTTVTGERLAMFRRTPGGNVWAEWETWAADFAASKGYVVNWVVSK